MEQKRLLVHGGFEEIFEAILDELSYYNSTEISLQAGLSHSTVHHWLVGRHKPRWTSLALVADALDLEIELFLYRKHK